MSTRLSRQLSLGFATVALLYSVLDLGGQDLIGWNISLFILAMGAIVYWLRAPAEDLAPAVDPWIGSLTLLLLLFIAFQLIPLPVFLLRILSPTRAGLVDNLAQVAPPSTFAPLSITPAVTSLYFLRVAGCTLAFVLLRELAWHARQHRSWAPAVPLIAIAAIEAIIGLAQSAGAAEAGSVSGTYANKNHFAGLLEMVLPIAVACGLALITGRRSRSSSSTSRAFAGGAVLVLAAVIIVGLVASLSKMGYVAGLSGLLVMGALALGTLLRGWRRWLAVAGLAAVFVFGLIFLPSDDLMRAFGSLFADELTTGEGRLPIFISALGLIRSYALVGCGLGTFRTGFLKFQTTTIDEAFTYAHNDYLQLASELGLVGFLIVAALMLAIFSMAVRAAIRGEDRVGRFLGLGCVGALTAIGVHSLADFNTYIPANALVLAWIAGIAASLRAQPAPQEHATPPRNFFRPLALTLSAVLLVYAPAWILFETSYRSDPRAERLFCRFGICDTDAVLDQLAAAHGGNRAALPTGELVAALGRDPAEPVRWCDLGEALARRRQLEQARHCFSNALALGPYVPTVLIRASDFYFDQHDEKLALEQNARVLEKTSTYDDSIFQWSRAKNIPVADVLSHGLGSDGRAAQAYLRYWIALDKVENATAVWNWSLARSLADEKLARDYANFLFGHEQYETAAQSWARFLGAHRAGYLDTNWLYNGDFESEPEGLAFDWRMEGLGDDVEVARDASVAHTGTHSLRIHFAGKTNVNFGNTFETSFVTPGTYRFEAFVRTEGITTDQGIGFQISSETPRLDIKTEKLVGTNGWKKIERVITVPSGAPLLQVRVIREASLKFDSLIAGTAWVDSVRLVKLN
jgi:putative inorganic carbon (hco3(-)) transporter